MTSSLHINDVLSHPTVGVAPFGTKLSDQLSSLSEGPAVRINALLACSFEGLAHKSAGREAQTNFFRVLYLGEILSSECEELRNVWCNPAVGWLYLMAPAWTHPRLFL